MNEIEEEFLFCISVSLFLDKLYLNKLENSADTSCSTEGRVFDYLHCIIASGIRLRGIGLFVNIYLINF